MVAAFDGKEIIDNEEIFGCFGGYLRRPLPSLGGMTAQFFGENGEDADIMLALSLSKYQDKQVIVNVYLVKDNLGQLMKENDGSYPMISSFEGYVRRTKSIKEGVLAQIYATNGPFADAVSELSKSDYQDALVFVDVRNKNTKASSESINFDSYKIIQENYKDKITAKEKAEYEKKVRVYRKRNDILKDSMFLYNENVAKEVGDEEDFVNWINKTQQCMHYDENGGDCMKRGFAQELNESYDLNPYPYLALCDEHKSVIEDNVYMTKRSVYHERKYQSLKKDWIWEKFQEQFSMGAIMNNEPDPDKIINWATSKNLLPLLPNKYLK